MPGDKERDRLIAHLCVTEGLAVTVADIEQHRKEVAVILATCASLVNHPLHGAADCGEGGAGAAIMRRRQPERGRQEAQQRVLHMPHPNRDGGAQRVLRVGKIGVKERLANNRHRQGRHFVPDIERRAVAPRRLPGLDAGGHCVRIVRERAGLKGGRERLPLFAVCRPFKDQDAVATDGAKREPLRPALLEVAVMLHEHGVCEGGAIDEVALKRAEVVAADVTALRRHACEKRQPVALHRAHTAEQARLRDTGDRLGRGGWGWSSPSPSSSGPPHVIVWTGRS